MSDDPSPTPNPRVDPQSSSFLERAARLSKGNDLSQLSISDVRSLLDKLQTPTPAHPDIKISKTRVQTSHGHVNTFIFKLEPDCIQPYIFYAHGGAYILGNVSDFYPLIFDLVRRTRCALVFPEYTLAPESKFPVQQEQCLEVLQHVAQGASGHEFGLSNDRIVVLADSAGGQIACAMSILNHQRKLHLPITHQVLLHPLVDLASISSRFSQYLFQDGPFLTSALIAEAVANYLPNPEDAKTTIASPILMKPEEVKDSMPSTTIVTSQVDWVRDQGEDFAKLLQDSGVTCGIIRAVGSLHDAEVFQVTRESPTVELVILAIAGKVREVLFPAVEALTKSKKRKAQLK